MSDATTLLEETSPYGNVMAVVEQDGSSCHMYLYGDSSGNFQPKSCWVRNLREAPDSLDVAAMRNGLAPMMPRQFCRHPFGASPLLQDRLRIVWAETGDAAALFDGDELLASIPAWSGNEGFHGYARDCVGESPLAWELGTAETNAQFKYFQEQEENWRSWDEEPGPWPAFQKAMCQAYNEQLGTHSNYYAIDGGEWPPRALLRIDEDERIMVVTLGMSLRAQPRVEMLFDDPSMHRRIELGGCLESTLDVEQILRYGRYLGAQTNLPWAQLTYLGHGHTIACDTLKELTNDTLTSVLLWASLPEAPSITLPTYRDDPIQFLWTVPISERERGFAMQKGSRALIDHFTAKRVPLFPCNLARRCSLE